VHLLAAGRGIPGHNTRVKEGEPKVARHGAGNIRQEIRFVLERDVRILGVAAEAPLNPYLAPNLRSACRYDGKLLLEAVVWPSMSQISAASALNPEGPRRPGDSDCDPIADAPEYFWDLSAGDTDPDAHGVGVKPEAAFGCPIGRADGIVPGEAIPAYSYRFGPFAGLSQDRAEGLNGIGNPKVARVGDAVVTL